MGIQEQERRRTGVTIFLALSGEAQPGGAWLWPPSLFLVSLSLKSMGSSAEGPQDPDCHQRPSDPATTVTSLASEMTNVAGVAMKSVTSAMRSPRREDLQFKASLGFRMSSKPA